MPEVNEHDQSPIQEHKNSEEGPVCKIKGIKILKISLTFNGFTIVNHMIDHTQKFALLLNKYLF